MTFQLVAGGVLVLFLLLSFVFPRRRLPPGPRGLPILGNLLTHPKEYEWLHWAKHKDIYGPISSVTILGQPVIILNDLQTCVDLLEKRSAIYSGRPVLPFAGEMIGWNQQMILSPYGDRFRNMRKMVHRFIGTKSAITAFIPIQHLQTRLFLARTFEKPENLFSNIRLAQGAIFLRMSHGYNIKSSTSDPFVAVVEKAAQQFYIATVPGAWLVDTFPLLRFIPSWFPFASFKRVAAEFRATNMEQANLPHDFVKQQMRENTALPSFTSSMLQTNLDELEEDAAKWASNSLYAGGTDTVMANISTFFLAMTLYPAVQRKAQAEVDSVVGPHRLPTFADRDNLPYIEALMKELMRWHTIGPMGIPHLTTESDVYNGYDIPKGSIVFSNIWEIGHDKANYTDPDSFLPERFLGSNPELDPHKFAFGFGRRGCPGQELADANVFLSIAMSLAVFDIKPIKDSVTGEELIPKAEFISGTVCHPKPFPCDIRPRSQDAVLLIRSVYDSEEVTRSVK
ncbi:cytochrome P450 oxidoreductase [Gautieria morchelliformis]|nr:cytochrome P450 oxidoreductase [Gautieria morchelliformis]